MRDRGGKPGSREHGDTQVKFMCAEVYPRGTMKEPGFNLERLLKNTLILCTIHQIKL
jgi:hypothetical protein